MQHVHACEHWAVFLLKRSLIMLCLLILTHLTLFMIAHGLM